MKRQGAFSCLYCLQEKCLPGEGKGNENYSVDYRDHFYRGLVDPDRGVQTDFLISVNASATAGT